MADTAPIQQLSAPQLLQLQDYFGLNLSVLQSICESVSQRVHCEISIMAEGGIIVASSMAGRLGKQHEGSAAILRGDIDFLDVDAKMEQESPVMLEGCNQPIELDGARIASVGITAPLAKARNYAAIVQTCIEFMLQAHLANWRNAQHLAGKVEQATLALEEQSAEKRSVEASLVRSEKRLKEITEYMFDTVWETDSEHCFTFISEGLLEGNGLIKSDFIGKTRWGFSADLVINRDDQAWLKHQNDMESHQDFRDFYYAMQLPSGVIKHLMVSGKAMFDESSEFLGYRGAARDVTEQYVAEEALRESEIRFQNIAESSSDWIWVMDEQLCFSYMSDRFYDITGLLPTDIIGKTRDEFAGPEIVASDPEKWKAHFADLRARERIVEFDYKGIRDDGHSYCIKINGSPYFKADGSFAGYHGTGTDYTELKNTRDQLLRSEKLAGLGGMVAGVAHEINTPVGNALTAASFIKSETVTIVEAISSGQLTRSLLNEFLAESEETSDILLHNLGQAIHLINNFKQVAVDQSSDQVRRFNLAEYIDGVRLSLHSVLKKGEHQLDIECPDEIELYSEPGALYQVLTNLVTNSMTHGFADGRRGCISIKVDDFPKQVEITYLDNGLGMGADQQARMFEPFYTTKRGSGSTGLGMYLVHNLIRESLQGEISCDSQPEKGVKFKLIVPKDVSTQCQ